MTNFYLFLKRGDGWFDAFHRAFGFSFNNVLIFINMIVCMGAAFVLAYHGHQQDMKLKTLEALAIKCTDRGDHSIVIDDEIWMCGAAPTGIKVR